ncbi:glucose dehydrogenase [FAD, quinone]-like isoform X1 [Diabrotica virgifera virgifera]|uniref:Glucose dehydrogenase [FAD, quinone]-like isoform X1 n=1 Tax=Diabrotica virgifera virgifera TaxID=50390 RepID=A0A6P7FED0_DIAVI|nr:glucose dehydrogenase [FAD, quinone]-like isoform X1 [Diabrotica virgifera virgifera]
MEGIYGLVQYDFTPFRGPLANAFLVLLNALFFKIKLIGVHDVYPKDHSEFLLEDYDDNFDFVIVGAGSAGCSLANRLTEDGQWSVLLLEAGDYPSVTTTVPAFHKTLVGSAEDWSFRLEKDEHACNSFENQICTISRGKVLGGTSSINDLIYTRGATFDYDKGDYPAWGSNISYAILKKLEKYQEPDDFYGHEGLIQLEYANFTDAPKELLTMTYESLGYSRMLPSRNIGFEEHLVTRYRGERFNMARNFLTPIKNRPNFYFSKNSEVFAVGLAEPVDKRAIGVNVSIRGEHLFIKAKKEVILTAGAINNAKILLLSGIGPKDYLESKGIKPYVDIKNVGKNLHFHLVVPLYVALDPCCSTCNREFSTEDDLVRDTFNYILYRYGNFSQTNLNEFTAYVAPNLEKAYVPTVAISHQFFKINDRYLEPWIDSIKYDPKIIQSLVKHNKERAIIVFLVKLLHPKSRGELYLNDTYHMGNPTIIPKFMSDPANEDYNVLLSGFDFVTNLTDSMKEEQAEFLDLNIPNCRNYRFCTPAYVKCYIQNMAYPNNDVTSSTFMGPECDDTAVVKEDLEVHGVRCLRVADSSAMNNIPIGNTIATDAMIGFQMGEILQEKWDKDFHSVYKPHPYEIP